MRALAWEFPNDPTLASADRQFLLGPSILVTPVLEPLARSVNGVFPGIAQGTIWYDWYNQSKVDVQAYANTTIDAPLTHLPLYVRGGSILPQQEARMTTIESRKSPWSLIVALSSSESAEGSLYIDDGESVTPNATLQVQFTAGNGKLYASSTGLYNDTNQLGNVTVLGVHGKPGNVTLNSIAVPFTYDEGCQVLSMKGLGNATSGIGAWSSDWVIVW